jgi:hypothetical protein
MSDAERDELHEALRGAADAATPRAIDVDAVLHASRARRRARRSAVVGGAGAVAAVLAVGGLVFGLQQGVGPTSGGAPAAVESAESGEAPAGQDSAGTPESATGFLTHPADVIRCGAPAAATSDAATSALVVAVTPPRAVAPGRAASATVTIANPGGTRIEGELWTMPVIAVVDHGTTVSRSLPADAAAVPISLEPGESTTVTGAIETTRCSTADAATPGPATSPEPLPAGAYELVAVVGFAPAGGEPMHLVSPLVPLTIR